MKILHVIVGLNGGGAELSLMRLVLNHSSSFGATHIVVSLTGLGTVGPKLVSAGIDVIALGAKSYLGALLLFPRLVVVIYHHRPDIVQTWMYHADLLGGLAARVANVRKIIWGVRSTAIDLGGSRATLYVRRICAYLSSWLPSTIVCVAHASKLVHIKVGYSAKKMRVIFNGLDLPTTVATSTHRESMRLQLGISSSDVVIGSVGRYHPVKDYVTFLKAAKRVLVKHNNLKFLLVGRGLDQRNDELMDLIGQTDSPSRFILLGERNDVRACLKAMDFFCCHSKTEGFPNALAEAMSVGLPCVTTDVGDAALIMQEFGLVVQPNSASMLTEAIERLLAMPASDRALMGLGASRRVHTQFTMQAMVDAYQRLYSELLGIGHSNNGPLSGERALT